MLLPHTEDLKVQYNQLIIAWQLPFLPLLLLQNEATEKFNH